MNNIEGSGQVQGPRDYSFLDAADFDPATVLMAMNFSQLSILDNSMKLGLIDATKKFNQLARIEVVSNEVSAMQDKAAHYLAKPFERDQLEVILEKWCSRDRRALKDGDLEDLTR